LKIDKDFNFIDALNEIKQYLEKNKLENLTGKTQILIAPGYEVKSCVAIVTNFHQPGTTHLLLVEALLGKDLLHKVYSHALGNHYRFLSYGDGMLVL
jgi:S-adenosylmethionine:tRNA ribosyltransferase-isomerase